MKDLLKDYLEYMESLNYSPVTIKSFKYICLRCIRDLNKRGITEVVKLKNSDLIEWQKHLAKRTNWKGLPIKAKSINHEISGVKSFLHYLAKKGYVLDSLVNILKLVKEPKMLPLGVFSHKELEKIIAKIDTTSLIGYRDRTILELLYTSAIRASELVGLNVTSIDFNNGTARVFGKGRKERVVPVGKVALKYLETYIKAVRPFILNGRESEALFISRKLRRLSYDALLKLVHRYADATDIEENITPHTFRRSATTELVRNGANLYHVKDMLGHESLDTLKHYTKLTITDLKKTHRLCHPREKHGLSEA